MIKSIPKETTIELVEHFCDVCKKQFAYADKGEFNRENNDYAPSEFYIDFQEHNGFHFHGECFTKLLSKKK